MICLTHFRLFYSVTLAYASSQISEQPLASSGVRTDNMFTEGRIGAAHFWRLAQKLVYLIAFCAVDTILLNTSDNFTLLGFT